MIYRLNQKLPLPWEGFHLKAGFQIQVKSVLKVHCIVNLSSVNKRLLLDRKNLRLTQSATHYVLVWKRLFETCMICIHHLNTL